MTSTRSGRSNRRGTPESKGPESRPDRVGELLPKVIAGLGLTREVARQAALTRWDGVVGEKIARVAQPTAVSKGVLFVRVTSSAWLSELNLMRRDILARLNAGSGEGRIERIVFTLAERGVRSAPQAPEASRTRSSPTDSRDPPGEWKKP